MAFYEGESTTTTAVVQQHEWLLVSMRERRLHVCTSVCARAYLVAWRKRKGGVEGWIRRNGITTKKSV